MPFDSSLYPNPIVDINGDTMDDSKLWGVFLTEAWRIAEAPIPPIPDELPAGYNSELYPDPFIMGGLSVDPEALHVGQHLSEFDTEAEKVEARESLELQKIDCGEF